MKGRHLEMVSRLAFARYIVYLNFKYRMGISLRAVCAGSVFV